MNHPICQKLEDLEEEIPVYKGLMEQLQILGWALYNCWKTLNMEEEISLLAYKGFGIKWKIPGWPLYNYCLQNRS
jgi:hypothetical protein